MADIGGGGTQQFPSIEILDEKEGEPPGLEAGLEVDEEFMYDKDEAAVLRSFPDIDDLASTLFKLNKTVHKQGVIGEKGSRESSSAAEWAQEDELYLHERNELDFDISNVEGQQWSSQPYSSPNMPDSKPSPEFFLPLEIIFNILAWLPVKSILRFRCVCKQWLSIINSPAFVDCHGNRSKYRPGILVTLCVDKSADERKEESRYLFLADQPKEQEALILRQSVTMAVKNCPIPHVVSPGDLQSVSGLVFGLCSQERIRVANPSTNECVTFPQSPSYATSYIKKNRYVSLGFDPIEGKHKFLETVSIFDRHYMEKRTEHRVVTVGDYGNWRSVDGPYIDRRKQYCSQEICVKGVIYFIALVTWACEGIETELCMVAFDVKSEKFQAVELSFKGRFCSSHYPWIFGEFEGKVGIVDYPFSNMECSEFEDVEHALELWVLEDFQTQDWSLKFAGLPPPLPMKLDNPYRPKHKLVGTTCDGKLMFAVFEGGDDLSYSNYDAMIQDVTEKGVPLSFIFFDMKTRDFWSSQVRLPDGFALNGQVRITALGHVENLLSVL